MSFVLGVESQQWRLIGLVADTRIDALIPVKQVPVYVGSDVLRNVFCADDCIVEVVVRFGVNITLYCGFINEILSRGIIKKNTGRKSIASILNLEISIYTSFKKYNKAFRVILQVL